MTVCCRRASPPCRCSRGCRFGADRARQRVVIQTPVSGDGAHNMAGESQTFLFPSGNRDHLAKTCIGNVSQQKHWKCAIISKWTTSMTSDY